METIASPERDTIVSQLIQDAYEIVDQKYGLDSPNPKDYHNAEHARDVVEAAWIIADIAAASGNIDESEKDLAVIAAAYHDVEQDLGSGDNEAASADLAERKMVEAGIFTPVEIQKVRNAILKTETFLRNGRRIQLACEADDYLAQIVADADMANLGRESEFYWDRSVKYFHETHPGEELEGDVLLDFIDRQIILLEYHRFHTNEARNLFPHIYRNKAYTEAKKHGNDNII
jgi:predicted metal-dependent HD superfamily phosphohydrolase